MTAEKPPEWPAGAVYLLRHGETEWSATGRHTGVTDLSLTTRGRDEARRAGELLARLRGDAPPPLVLTSPRARARQTAELAGLTGEVVHELAEWDYGDYEGRTTPEIREQVPDWTIWSRPTPNGETSAEVGRRADAVLTTVSTRSAGRDVVLVSHGHLLRVLIARALGLQPDQGVRFALQTAAITVLGAERGVPQLRSLNLR
ncbi:MULTISPECIES: histidine phosphatase family protein [Actinoalloteichus]|uniref:Fructose-2,6-bisphosphatase n=1 Tax=Actinoalloteichus fjordicus TaxID=1612552 RepID=A0AAC9PU32_9PSEU|nr:MULTISPECIES: histidine phosphatase family protein [Actinoalloteichus]APU17284.1 fructose-2,6-bisphosphatase [Actinoalloteichus fjordicus]APU23367.1 fructose-2,6-bisphosphatase [Actinoalloteichus sp. GBA129-24]